MDGGAHISVNTRMSITIRAELKPEEARLVSLRPEGLAPSRVRVRVIPTDCPYVLDGLLKENGREPLARKRRSTAGEMRHHQLQYHLTNAEAKGVAWSSRISRQEGPVSNAEHRTGEGMGRVQ